MTLGAVRAPRLRGYLIQCLMLLSINVPTVSFGLAMGWVSLASGECGGSGERGEGALVGAAAATFAAGLLGVPLGARALRLGRRPALAATSAAFAVSWALTLAGGWWVLPARLCAGVAGAVAWCIAPLLGREMIVAGAGGAAAAAPVLAHNLGMLLMYLAADTRLHHSTVEWWCLALAALHCAGALLAPESPAYLAAQGRHKEAVAALGWLRGVGCDHPALVAELRALPPPEPAPRALLQEAKDMLSDRRRRRAFLIALVAVVGQETCGLLTLLQFAERVFLLAEEGEPGAGGGARAARHALVLGAVQLVAAAAALYLLERVGRRPLVVWGALVTGSCLALGAAGARAGRGAGWAGGALAAAVAADSLGLQPAPYAILADMFHYQYRSCAVLLVMAAASAGNAAETLVFPAVVHGAGLWAALALAAAATLLYALFAFIYVPETRNRSPDDIYDDICPNIRDEEAEEPRAGVRHDETGPGDAHCNTIDADNVPVNNVDDDNNPEDTEPRNLSIDASDDVSCNEERSDSRDANRYERGRIHDHGTLEITMDAKKSTREENCSERASESDRTSPNDINKEEVNNDSEKSSVYIKTSAVSLETLNEPSSKETQCTTL